MNKVTKVKHLIDADMDGPPENIRTELILSHKLEDCCCSLWFHDNTGSRPGVVTINGNNLHVLLKIKRDTPVKYGEIAMYSVGLHGRDPWLKMVAIEPGHITKMDLEVPRAHVDLALYTLGQIKLTKEQLKNHIIQMYDDNFEALKQLKKYGVLKNEKIIEQTLSRERSTS